MNKTLTVTKTVTKTMTASYELDLTLTTSYMVFLAVQNSSIGDLVRPSDQTNNQTCGLLDIWSEWLRHDLTKQARRYWNYHWPLCHNSDFNPSLSYYLTHKGDIGQPTCLKGLYFEKWSAFGRGNFQPSGNRFSQQQLYEYFWHLSKFSYKCDTGRIQQYVYHPTWVEVTVVTQCQACLTSWFAPFRRSGRVTHVCALAIYDAIFFGDGPTNKAILGVGFWFF